jgi:hypothetical protein
MICTIIIKGESAEDLFAAGPQDIKNHFLQKMYVKAKDVQSVEFIELTATEKKKMLSGKEFTYKTHKDNFK